MNKKCILAILAVSCIALAGCPGDNSPPPAKKTPPSSSRNAAPRGGGGTALFRLPDGSGRTVTVKTPAALFFLTSWCGYCKTAMPEVKRLTEVARTKGWWVYGIDVNEGPAEANAIVSQFQPNFPILLDQQGMIARQYGVTGYPTFVLIDQSGNVIYNSHSVPRGF